MSPSLIEQNNPDPLSDKEKNDLQARSGDKMTISVSGYLEQVGTMGSTFAVEEWDGGITRIRVPSRIVQQASEGLRQDQEGSGTEGETLAEGLSEGDAEDVQSDELA